MESEIVYLFLYNPMIYTSGWITQSIHKHRKTALTIMEEHKAMAIEKWAQEFQTEKEREEHPFGKFEDWRITPMKLL